MKLQVQKRLQLLFLTNEKKNPHTKGVTLNKGQSVWKQEL